jgi:hypothetical protein
MIPETAASATRITSATTTAVKAVSGEVHQVIIGATAAGTITFNDSVGAKLVLGASYPVGSYHVGIRFAGKIEVVTGAASDVTIVWS